MLLHSHKGRKMIGLACLALALALMAGCGDQGAHVRTQRPADQPLISLAAGDAFGQAVFGAGNAEAILAAREAGKSDTRLAVTD